MEGKAKFNPIISKTLILIVIAVIAYTGLHFYRFQSQFDSIRLALEPQIAKENLQNYLSAEAHILRKIQDKGVAPSEMPDLLALLFKVTAILHIEFQVDRLQRIGELQASSNKEALDYLYAKTLIDSAKGDTSSIQASLLKRLKQPLSSQEKSVVLYLLGRLALARRLEDSLGDTYIKASLERFPAVFNLYYYAQVCVRREDFQKAIHYFSEALKLNPEHFRSMMGQARIRILLSQEVETTVSALEKYLKTYSTRLFSNQKIRVISVIISGYQKLYRFADIDSKMALLRRFAGDAPYIKRKLVPILIENGYLKEAAKIISQEFLPRLTKADYYHLSFIEAIEGENETAGSSLSKYVPQTAGEFTDRAILFIYLNRFSEAYKEVTRARSLAPSFSKAKVLAALLAEVETNKSPVQKPRPKIPIVPGLYGVAGLIMGHLKQDRTAIQYLKKGLLYKPFHYFYNMALARIYHRQGQYKDSLRILHDIVQVYQMNRELRRLLAYNYFEIRNYPKAIEHLRYLTQPGHDPQILSQLVSAYIAGRDFQKAADLVSKMEKGGGDPELLRYLAGRIEYAQGKWDRAIEAFRQVKNNVKIRDLAKCFEARSRLQKKEKGDAVKGLLRKLKGEPASFIDMVSCAADFYSETGSPRWEVWLLKKMVHYFESRQVDPLYKLTLYRRLAEALFQLKEYQSAEETILKGLKMNPADPQANSLLGKIYYRINPDAGKAITLFLNVLQQNPQDKEAFYYLGRLYLKDSKDKNLPVIKDYLKRYVTQAPNGKFRKEAQAILARIEKNK